MSEAPKHGVQRLHSFKDVAQAVLHNIRHESQSEAHRLFREQPGHQDLTSKQPAKHIVPGIEQPGSVGVVYVTERAAANGFKAGAKDWANFGQGAPETTDLEGGCPRPTVLDLSAFGDDIHEYGPTTGITELRQKVADYYNHTFRQNKPKKIEAANIAIVPGGRAGLARIMSVLGPVLLGYSHLDYAAYEPLLGMSQVQGVPMQLEESKRFKVTAADLEAEVKARGLTTLLLSNPRNPTGQIIEGQELKDVVDMSSRLDVTTIMDEFYSHYLLEGELGRSVSAMEYIDDIEESNVVLVDGLTKNARLPGWRVCWVSGPRDLISAIGAVGSYLDGGASHPMQVFALPMLDLDRIAQDRLALQKHFRMKRDHVLKRLAKMGLPVNVPPVATFYIWLDLKPLPPPLNSGLVFAEELLKEKAIVTPGIFFDINPGHRRNIVDSPCESYIRISFGPKLEELDRGLDAFERVLAKAAKGDTSLGTNYARADPSTKHQVTPQAHG
ncbi:1-aminocyclopropane-1-carboxylate synthase, and related proteins [Ceraceosorus bombacis]|uniref:1-aminocyclopropane-1-carboxylate synthase, and related proteins n=1 Tax=Ceraceosorus bombacis TaxID=401625 RepID=A0A0P1BC22_9BASI|nr:1-aminocyclopropane-1-carboxylate synthase, and related proteins [Ceraceosorus bombacis]